MGLLVEVLNGEELLLSALPRLSSRRCYFQHVRHAAGPLQDVPWSEGEGNVIRSPAGGLHVWTRERRPHQEFSHFCSFFCDIWEADADFSPFCGRVCSIIQHSLCFFLYFRVIFRLKKEPQLWASGPRASSASKQTKGAEFRVTTILEKYKRMENISKSWIKENINESKSKESIWYL